MQSNDNFIRLGKYFGQLSNHRFFIAYHRLADNTISQLDTMEVTNMPDLIYKIDSISVENQSIIQFSYDLIMLIPELFSLKIKPFIGASYSFYTAQTLVNENALPNNALMPKKSEHSVTAKKGFGLNIGFDYSLTDTMNITLGHSILYIIADYPYSFASNPYNVSGSKVRLNQIIQTYVMFSYIF